MWIIVGVAVVLVSYRNFWFLGPIWLVVVGMVGWTIRFLNPSDPRGLVVLKWVSCYFLIVAITKPFVNEIWLIYFPVLTMFQWPQIALASWIRQRLSVNLTLPFGLDGGVRSPAAIYALCLADLGILTLTLGPNAMRTRKLVPYVRWTMILVGMVSLDAAAILWFHYKRLNGLFIY